MEFLKKIVSDNNSTLISNMDRPLISCIHSNMWNPLTFKLIYKPADALSLDLQIGIHMLILTDIGFVETYVMDLEFPTFVL